jgi:hypothetical protein
MAVYNIFASADATIYSRYPIKNTGRDPILEVSVKNSQDGVRFLSRTPLTDNPYYNYDLAADSNASNYGAYFPGEDIRRSLLQFSDADIRKLYTFASQSVSSSYEASLRLYLASAQNLNTTYSIDVYPVSHSWVMGTGQYAQTPQSTNGVSWLYTGPSGSSPIWTENGFYWGNDNLPTWESASYQWTFVPSASTNFYITGGGSWYDELGDAQYFDYMSNKDINVDITNILSNWFSGSVPNYGVIVKHPQVVEEDPNAFVDLKFFSVDTHTIYPPTIQFKWDDSYYYPQSTHYVLTDQVTITLANNPGQFTQGEVYKMRLSTRYTYPPRQFTTSSVYLTNLILSEKTYWALQDVKTGEMVVDFDENYTKLSCDSVGNYFTLYTSGLEIGRYYRLMVKTSIFSTTFGPLSVYDNEQSIYNALSLYGTDDLKLLPAEEVVYSGQNLVFKIVA